ncbi:MAG: hypothetical protein KGL93_07745 [Gemmatimonadota bacterium]|nr:hypothetical protein [Gemmatimonadota bacterium]
MDESRTGPVGGDDRQPSNVPHDASATAGGERAYVEPRLTVYGTLPVITAAVGTKGKKDGSGNRRTGF